MKACIYLVFAIIIFNNTNVAFAEGESNPFHFNPKEEDIDKKDPRSPPENEEEFLSLEERRRLPVRNTCERVVSSRDKLTGEPTQVIISDPDVYYGDVHISSPDQYFSLYCIRKIVGNLTIDDGEARLVILPRLEVVTGDLNLTYDQHVEYLESNRERNVSETIMLNRLARVGGSITLLSPDQGLDSDSATFFDFGMPNLTSIGEDLTIVIDTFNYDLKGIPNLTGIRGNFHFSAGSDDGSNQGFLENFSTIGGNADITLGVSTQILMFDALRFVGGDLTISRGNLDESNFSQLQQVVGKLTLDRVAFLDFDPQHLRSLEYAGYFKWDSGWNGRPFVLGSPSVLVGGLRLSNHNGILDPAINFINFNLTPTASVEFINNSNLRECLAQDWIDSFTEHVGKVSIVNNLEC